MNAWAAMHPHRSWHAPLAVVLAVSMVISPVAWAQEGAKHDITEERVTVKTMIGRVEIRSSGSATWRAARVGMNVRMGWDLRTYVESSLELQFENGTELRLGENSVVTLSKILQKKEAGAVNSDVKIAAGQVWANVKKLTNRQSRFRFETPTALASIRGTSLGVAVNRYGTSIDVYEGRVAVRSKVTDHEVMVTSETRAFVRLGAAGIWTYRFDDRETGDMLKDTVPPVEIPLDLLDGAQNVPDAPANQPADTVRTDSLSAPMPGAGVTGEGGQGSGGSASQEAPADTARGGAPSSGSRAGLEILYPTAGTVVAEPQVVVTGQTAPGAVASVADKEASVGDDGYFYGMVTLDPGPNRVSVKARGPDWERSTQVMVEYRPPLTLKVNNVVDGMTVVSPTLEVDLEVTEGAQFSVNGKESVTLVQLKPGPNRVEVLAWDAWGGRVDEGLTVQYKPTREFVLGVNTPADRLVVSAPVISVSGSTSPGAMVTVNGTEVPVGSGGNFSYKMHIPDEPGQYQITVAASFVGRELTAERTVEYVPPREPLKLVVATPADGQVIRQRSVRVSGATNANAAVDLRVNDGAVMPGVSGQFSRELQLSERDIGEYTVEVTASDDRGELTRSLALTIDGTSPLVNTSVPRLAMQTGVGQATRRDVLLVHVTDQTPDDEVTLKGNNNGVREESVVEPGNADRMTLDEGKNVYTIVGYDRAGNASNILKGTVYYLPGPLSLDLVEPADRVSVVDDLPPLPPGSSRPLYQRIEVEIDDGIGTVPESIVYCRVKGQGQDVALVRGGDYVYRGRVKVVRGTNSFQIVAEDMAGNRVVENIEISLED